MTATTAVRRPPAHPRLAPRDVDAIIARRRATIVRRGATRRDRYHHPRARARVVVRVDASQSHVPVGPTGRSRARFWTTTDYHYLK